MPADGVAFAISLGLNAAFFAGCYAFFAVVRNLPFCKKFYEPRRYVRVPGRHKPKRLPTGYVAWLSAVHHASQEAVIDAAGMDAAVYLSYASFCKELFIFATFWSLATVLPVNLVGKEVARLQSAAAYESRCVAESVFVGRKMDGEREREKERQGRRRERSSPSHPSIPFSSLFCFSLSKSSVPSRTGCRPPHQARPP
jgi:hypothetical protein